MRQTVELPPRLESPISLRQKPNDNWDLNIENAPTTERRKTPSERGEVCFKNVSLSC